MLSLAGCSNSKLSWSNEGFASNGTVLSIDEYADGQVNATINANVYVFKPCDSIIYCKSNTLGVLEENMTKFKKAKYYSAHMGSQYYMHYPVGDGFIEGICYVYNNAVGVEVIVDTLYKYCENLVLSEDVKEIPVGDKITLLVEDRTYKIRNDEILIPGTIKISADDGSKIMDSIVQVGKKDVAKTTVGNYDYYQYEGYIIQAIAGLDLSTYVKLK